MAKARALAKLVLFLAGRILGVDRSGRWCGGDAFINFACKLHECTIRDRLERKNFLPGLSGRLNAVSVPHTQPPPQGLPKEPNEPSKHALVPATNVGTMDT